VIRARIVHRRQEITMVKPARKLAFILAASNHGTMIVNRFDFRMVSDVAGYGVGHQILEQGAFDPQEINLALELLALRRKHHGDGVVAIDCGANIGVHSIEWGTAMTGWGSVLSIEAQERIYYALAGNIAINNCFNVIAFHGAVSSEGGTMKIPVPDYLSPSSFGSLELKKSDRNEFIGQAIDYAPESMAEVRKIALDEFDLPRVDFIKIDVEGMEIEVLQGALQTIEKSKPAMLIESIKTDPAGLRGWLEARGYVVIPAGINVVAIHMTDKTLGEIKR
jgi:FkbM family methyltransferase